MDLELHQELQWLSLAGRSARRQLAIWKEPSDFFNANRMSIQVLADLP